MTEKATSTRIGQPVRRREDLRLVTGKGNYTDDVSLPGQAYAAMVRSPHAHARIRGIDSTAAMEVPGVLAVLTGRDLIGMGWKPGPKFKEVLDAVQMGQLEGTLRTREEAISWVIKEFPTPTPGENQRA